MEEDTYRTVKSLSEGYYAEKRSRFLSFAMPVKTQDEAGRIVKQYRKKYFDARHVCWAYMLGHERDIFRAVDDGEPSSTAGKPILGQINSNKLTDILIIVVRYFGGIELGTSGLTAAYRTAAAKAITAAETEERTVDENINISFNYQHLNSVMRTVKEELTKIISQTFDIQCNMTLQIRKSRLEKLKDRLSKIETVIIKN
jgi:uncharacterized YigZ family protein